MKDLKNILSEIEKQKSAIREQKQEAQKISERRQPVRDTREEARQEDKTSSKHEETAKPDVKENMSYNQADHYVDDQNEFEFEPDLDDVQDDTVETEPDYEHVELSNTESTLLILQTIERLIDRIERLAETPPTVHIPAPIVEVQLPETRRTVKKVIQRDENGLIQSIDESITDDHEDEIKTSSRKE